MGQSQSNQQESNRGFECGPTSWCSISYKPGDRASVPLEQIARAPPPAQPAFAPGPAPPAPPAPPIPPAPVLRLVRAHRCAPGDRPARADRPAPAPAVEEPLERRGRQLRRHPSTTVASPCIAHGTWSPNRSWDSFEEKFLDQPSPVFLQLDEEDCPICFKAYFEDTQARPVRLPCDSKSEEYETWWDKQNHMANPLPCQQDSIICAGVVPKTGSRREMARLQLPIHAQSVAK